MSDPPSSPPGPDLSVLPVPVAAYKAPRKERCPMALPCDRFPDAAKLRCVREDTHEGLCMLIDGQPLTAAAVAPAVRYRAMDLPVPAHLRDALDELGARRRRHRRRPVLIASVYVGATVLSVAVLFELARAAGWLP